MREFRPELSPRRGEITAWGLWLVVSLVLAWMQRSRGEIPLWAWIFWGFLAFAALSISLGNWMDRHTVLRLDEEGMHFSNGLRHAALRWEELRRVTVTPTPLGRRVQVFGDNTFFQFKTLGEFIFQGEVRGRSGFAAGEEILQEILRRGNLTHLEKGDGTLSYTRQGN